MSSERKRLLLLAGPVIAVAFGAVAIVSDTGSAPFIFAIFGAIGFVLFPPVIQVVLLATRRFGERDFLACAIGLAVPASFLAVEVLLGMYDSY